MAFGISPSLSLFSIKPFLKITRSPWCEGARDLRQRTKETNTDNEVMAHGTELGGQSLTPH